ncbi:class I SAM-dependent methyltransferase [Collimonas humicola]|uniref:class I SAM-dependent methyltransferase n=1 Tax=Collimonas humicola TaxID=2825886 RepID=UPI001B8D57DF|nr:class I SAM-dependent methyltransferase [Collimonas humicola]
MNPLQENIVQAGKPSWTARWVAAMRAAHQLLDEPVIFSDPMALSILGPAGEANIRRDPAQFNDPISRDLRAALATRSLLAEDELRRAVAASVKQYVVLGAGLDTFAFRNGYRDQGLHVYEVDHPSTQVWKIDILKEAGIDVPDSMTFVAIDFEKSTLADRLQESGFRTDRPAYFSWLGVTVYLSEEAIFDTLKFVASLPRESGITFDYRVLPSMLSPIDYALGEYISNLVEEQGEPWKTSFNPMSLQKKLQSMGLHVTKDLGPAELNKRYLGERQDGLRTRLGFRLICAKK